MQDEAASSAESASRPIDAVPAGSVAATSRRARPTPFRGQPPGGPEVDGHPGRHSGGGQPAAPPPAPAAAVPADARTRSEAQTIIADALEQARLVATRAEQAADALLADAREDADRASTDGRTAARVLREQAEAIVVAARQRATEIEARADAAATAHSGTLDHEREEHKRRLLAAQVEFDAELERLAHQAAVGRGRLQAEAENEVRAIQARGSTVVETAEQEAASVRARAAAAAEKLLNDTHEAVAAEIAEAAEQTAWTKQTMSDLLAAAEADAENAREQAAAQAATVLADADARAAAVLDEAQARQRAADELIAAQRAEVQDEYTALLEAAQADAADIRQHAGDDAEEIFAASGAQAAEALEHARRREAEAEVGARAVREQAADDLERIQAEARDLRRASKDEAARLVADARSEADEMRSAARALLSEARAEVAVLTANRDEITKQLGDLSGVINALAVADRAMITTPEELAAEHAADTPDR